MFLTLSLAEKMYAYICGTARETDQTVTAKIKAITVTHLIPFFSLWAGQVWYNIVLFTAGVLGACLICVVSSLVYRGYVKFKNKRNIEV